MSDGVFVSHFLCLWGSLLAMALKLLAACQYHFDNHNVCLDYSEKGNYIMTLFMGTVIVYWINKVNGM